ncbi:hypothetical protein [Streptomyces sp. NPDC001537]
MACLVPDLLTKPSPLDHDAPDPGPRPWQTYAALVGGPLDALLLDITGRSPWPGGSAPYDPHSGAPRTPGPGR